MCTVTIVPLDEGFRLVCNRDESVARPVAAAPRPARHGGRLALYPVDPIAGGTWVAANDAGLVMTLLNMNDPQTAAGEDLGPGGSDSGTARGAAGASDPEGAAAGLLSRGLIIPRLLDAGGAREAAGLALQRIDPARHAPFRLVIADDRSIATVTSDGGCLVARPGPIGRRPWMFTSSGLGDQMVIGPRARLFESMLRGADDPAIAQDAFHRHRWIDRPHLSVLMSRPGARTVSRTVVERAGPICRMTHQDLPAPGAPEEDMTSWVSNRCRTRPRWPSPPSSRRIWPV